MASLDSRHSGFQEHAHPVGGDAGKPVPSLTDAAINSAAAKEHVLKGAETSPLRAKEPPGFGMIDGNLDPAKHVKKS